MTAAPPAAPTRRAIESLTLKGAVAMAIAYAASRFGLALPIPAAESAAQALIDLLFHAGLIAVGVGRARALGPLR